MNIKEIPTRAKLDVVHVLLHLMDDLSSREALTKQNLLAKKAALEAQLSAETAQYQGEDKIDAPVAPEQPAAPVAPEQPAAHP